MRDETYRNQRRRRRRRSNVRSNNTNNRAGANGSRNGSSTMTGTIPSSSPSSQLSNNNNYNRPDNNGNRKPSAHKRRNRNSGNISGGNYGSYISDYRHARMKFRGGAIIPDNHHSSSMEIMNHRPTTITTFTYDINASGTRAIRRSTTTTTNNNINANERCYYSRDRVGRWAARTRGRRTNHGHNNNNENNNNNTAIKYNKSNNHNNTTTLREIKVSKNSIHSDWKRELGALLRYYVHVKSSNNTYNNNYNNNNNYISESLIAQNQKRAEEEIDQIYYQSKCSIQNTKSTILQQLGVTQEIQNDWVTVCMAIEKEGLNEAQLIMDDGPLLLSHDYAHQTCDKKGIKLHQISRPGEGPAHYQEQWTTILIPTWAIGKSYYFELTNKSPIHLSCEIFLDGEMVATNAPLPANDTRTVRPNNYRYCESHKWILKPAIRVKLQEGDVNHENGSNGNDVSNVSSGGNGGETVLPTGGTTRRPTPRYNNTRPDYAGTRVSIEAYPDPTSFGWTFTGSVQESRVEFFEKVINMGIVKLDWYYTTASTKTVLNHPSSAGRNALFRNTVSSEQFMEILNNPRAHIGRGYREAKNRPEDVPVDGDARDSSTMEKEEEDDEFDRLPATMNGNPIGGDSGTLEMEDASQSVASAATYYAKNEGYDFKKEGHMNRRHEMKQLHKSNVYAQWEEAAKKEYAVIHAKFYISLPKRQYASPPNNARHHNAASRHGNGRKERQLEPLPEQSKVVDIKAAEQATLGTDFLATGPPRSTRRSSVRMDRINGLKDDSEWKGAPVYEKKLYYRAENIVNGQGMGHDSDLGEADDDIMDDENDNGATMFNQDIPLEEYKNEKINQAKQYHVEYIMYYPDPEESAQHLRSCMNKIGNADSVEDIDDSLKLFYDELVKNQFNRRRTLDDAIMDC